MIRIGFIGQGYVGKNYADDFERRGYRPIRYSLEEPYIANKDKIADCDLVIIAVPTPTTKKGFEIRHVEEALTLVGTGKIVLLKSTVTPGTTARLQAQNPHLTLLFSPEFLLEATAAQDAAHPFANVIGCAVMDEAHQTAAELALAVLPKAPYEKICTSTDAELVKYAHNISGYTQIVSFNLLYDLAEKLGADWPAVEEAVRADPYISNHYARPFHKSGRGAGGHCFIKDFAAFRLTYTTMTGDSFGIAALTALEAKNNELLVRSQKDLDILKDVYGEQVLDDAVLPSTAPSPTYASAPTMKLLVCTESIDVMNPVTGFFHRWVEEFARHANHVTVISLDKGEWHLPANTAEYSLGRSRAGTASRLPFHRFLYALRFLGYVWKLRREYDSVLVHLNEEYVLLAGLIWRILGVRVGFWHNNPRARFRSRLAAWFSQVVFYSRPDSYAVAFTNAQRIAIGVDTRLFATTPRDEPRNSLLFLGRIAPQKQLNSVCEAIEHVSTLHPEVHLSIYGSAHRGQEDYLSELQSCLAPLQGKGVVSYHEGVPHDQTPAIFAKHDIFVHAGSVSGQNQTLFEAMAAGCLIISSNPELSEVLHPDLFIESLTTENLVHAIKAAFELTEEERERERKVLRAYVLREHSLSSVVPAMLEAIEGPSRYVAQAG